MQLLFKIEPETKLRATLLVKVVKISPEETLPQLTVENPKTVAQK